MESFLRFPFSRSFSTRFVTISFRSKDSFLQPVSLDFPGTQVYNKNQSILFQEVLNMNAIIENLLTRRSTRAFLQRQIPDNELNEILQAAIYAPSGMGRQTWKFTVLCNQEKIQQLAELIGRKLGRKGYDMYRPQVLIIPSNQKENPHGMEDNACALENIFLAAHSFGIGSVWINQLRTLCDDPEVRALLDEFEIPSGHVVYGMAALGYPADAPKKEIHKIGEIRIIK